MKWYVIDKDYIDYLKTFDSSVPNINYGKDKLKCFLGVIVMCGNLKYFVPLTSPKERNADFGFMKLLTTDKRGNELYIAALNVYRMIPVKEGYYYELTFENLGNYRQFEGEYQKQKYWRLLNFEMSLVDERRIVKTQTM